MAALLDEAKKHNLGSTAHLQQTGVAQMNALTAAKLGLRTVTHFYGHFEALLKDYDVQPWPVDQINNDEQMRFGQVARLWDKIHPPGSPEWKAYLEEHRKLGHHFDPTMTAYAAGRDVMRMRNADWHARYTLPSLMDFYTPSREHHGSYWFDWTLDDEIAWRNFYQVWFRLLNDYKKMGGRVTVERRRRVHLQHLRLRQHPRDGAAAGGGLPSARSDPGGDDATRPMTLRGSGRASRSIAASVRAGLLADLVIVDQNPLQEPEGALRHRRAAPERPDRASRNGSAASSTRSRTASSTTRRNCWRTSPRWSRNSGRGAHRDRRLQAPPPARERTGERCLLPFTPRRRRVRIRRADGDQRVAIDRRPEVADDVADRRSRPTG